jgi:SAM-dependent methyltransferase
MSERHADEYADRVKGHFDGEARTFDAHYDAVPAGFLDRCVDRGFRTQRLNRRLELVIDATRGATSVLEVGSGSGRVAVAIAGANPRATVTGIDFSGSMNGMARAWASRHGVADRCGFIDGDFLTHDFGRTFDVVVAPGVFDYIREPGGALRRLCELSSRGVGVSFPARYRALVPLRWMRLRAQRCPVRFYSRGELEAMAGATGARVDRFDQVGSWVAGFYWLVLGTG